MNNLRTFLAVVSKEYDKQAEAKKQEKMKFKAARAFNEIYTYGKARYQKNEHAVWMCPKCNSIKKQIGYSGLAGNLFEACCDIPSGHRWYKDRAARD